MPCNWENKCVSVTFQKTEVMLIVLLTTTIEETTKRAVTNLQCDETVTIIYELVLFCYVTVTHFKALYPQKITKDTNMKSRAKNEPKKKT